MTLPKRLSMAAAESLALALSAVLLSSCNLCGNQTVAEYLSPDGTRKVVVYERDCGATTDFSTQASLVATGTGTPSGIGDLFVAHSNHAAAPDGPGGGPELRVRWIDATHVELSYHAYARVSRSEASRGGVRISYVTFR